MKQERTLLQTKQTNSGLLMTSGNAFWTRTTQCLNTKEDNGQEADFRMQENIWKCCIRPSSPYLNALLKPDNLPEICNNISEKVLRRQLQLGCRNCLISAAMAPLTPTNCALATPSPAITAPSRSV